MIEDVLAKTFVEGIEQGLRNAKSVKKDNGDVFDNSEHFRKVDKIMTSLYYRIQEVGSFEVKEFYRGGYKLLLAYNKENHKLFSFMSEDRMNTLINSNKFKDKQNYIFSLMQFNPDERQQQVIFPDIDVVTDELQKIQNRVRAIIQEDGAIEYNTVLYKIVGYRLLKVRVVKMSQYAEVLDELDLSNYITVDYGDVYEDTTNDKEELFGDLEFNFKDDILVKSGNLDVDLEKEEEIKNG